MVPGLGCLYIWDLGVSFKTVMTSVTTLYLVDFKNNIDQFFCKIYLLIIDFKSKDLKLDC